MAVSTACKQVWPMERYARYIAPREHSSVITCSQDQGGDGNNWQHYSSLNGPQIHMILINSNHFLIKQGDMILESFSLWGTPNWIKGIAKGDSLLFLYRQQTTTSRKFRVKVAGSSEKTSVDNCRDIVCTLKSLIPIKTMDEPPPVMEKCIEVDGHSGSISLKERAQDILTKPLSQAYTTHLPTGQLSHLIRLCLTDSTFPAFVEAVENELNGLK